MVVLEQMARRQITGANYITSVNGMLHPDRILPEHDFLYMLDGEWEICEEDAVYELHTDDLLILASGRHHYGRKLCSRGNRHMYIHVLPTQEERRAKLETPALFSCASLLHCGANPQVRRYFQELIAAYWSKEEQREDRMTLLFNLLLCELRSLPDGGRGDRRRVEPILEQVRQKLYSTPQLFYSAGEMAEQFYICPRTLNNYFQKAYGKTFSAYQMDLKLEMVREYLRGQPEARLHEAAVNFGFYDEFHLSKAFKKKYGQPPSRLRFL